jgi:hypothetical protein
MRCAAPALPLAKANRARRAGANLSLSFSRGGMRCAALALPLAKANQARRTGANPPLLF